MCLFELLFQRYRRKSLITCLEIRFMALKVLFLKHWRLFCVDKRYGCQDTGEKLFAGLEIGFRAFIVLFLEHLMLFSFDFTYGCQVTGENLYWPALKSGLRHSPFYFWNIGGYFTLIGGTIAKIPSKTFICRL